MISSEYSMMTTVVGYGLQDISIDDDNYIVDSRVNPSGYLLSPYNFSIKGYRSSISAEIAELVDEHHILSDFIIRRGNILCIVPPDRFDLVDLQPLKEPLERLEWLDHVPGVSGKMDCMDGHGICSSVYLLFKQKYAELNRVGLCSVEKMNLEYSLTELADMMGFRTIDDAIGRIVSVVPESVLSLCKYAKLFNTDSTAFSLKPMRYSS